MTDEQKIELILRIPELSTNDIMEMYVMVNLALAFTNCKLMNDAKRILNEELTDRIKPKGDVNPEDKG